ncbi:MAG: tRNA (adenosine(37)-N6)-threonylcarbamoyltransferase complex dimerization subunit type 1 TsaB [Deltaproteobacteria bacterium]|nr:tRNA (adenosine(37)-N6)-threonylcarbamoyltransferase complex dimerization subunit type 1 TsaB [Deltaproteobacteria bacterium]
MTALLALDTAAETVGVAVAVGGTVRAEVVEASAAQHSRRLFRLIDAALEGAGVAKGDLNAVAVTAGPGSFTGLRIGVAAAKGIAYGLGLPLAGVSTLEALAAGAMPFPGVVAPILDARKGQVYGGAWDGRTGQRVVPEGVWEPSALAAALAEGTGPVLVLGSGLGPYAEIFSRALGERFLAVDSSRWAVAVRQVARLGLRELEAGRAVEPARLVPIYFRLSEAEEKKRLAALGAGPGS